MNAIVTSAWKTQRGHIAHAMVDENGVGLPVLTYTAVYGGLSWPSFDSPAYHCILGEEFAGSKDGEVIRGKLRLLAESESEGISIDGFFARVTADATHLHCDTIFAAMDESKYADFTAAYGNYCFEHRVHFGRLERAPFEKEFMVGAAMIKDWAGSGRLDLPVDSLVYQQLKGISRSDLGEQPEIRFYAINALRFAVAGFHTHKPSRPRSKRRRRRGAMVI
jgi:hypothetical protein